MRTIFVWDIHWCFDEFLALLEKIKYNPDGDKLYLTWDLINKWPKAVELIDFLVKNPQIKSVIGNNEVNFLRRKSEEILKKSEEIKNNENYRKLVKKGLFDRTYWKHNPLFEEYLEKFSKEHIEYLISLPLWIESSDWILLHGGLVPGKSLEQHSVDEITRIRLYEWKPWYEYYDWEKTIIYWHWAADGLRFRQKTKGLDTGCVYGKRLTAYIWETGEIIQQSAFKTYLTTD